MPKRKSNKKTTKKIKIPKTKLSTKEQVVVQEDFVKKISIKFFGRLADKYSENFIPIKESLIAADLRILFRTYLTLMFFSTFLTFSVTFFFTLISLLILRVHILFIALGVIIVPSLFGSITFLLVYSYPISIRETRKRDIEVNLPFALTHMAAVAESGAPPLTIFKILSQFEEYGEISKEAGRIKRDVEVFGLDALSALKERIQKTPSQKFQDILQGMLNSIQSGGDIRSYLSEESKKSMFDYAVRKQKYNELMSVYADLYTALLLAAPMIFIVVLSMLAILGGNIFNLGIQQIMDIGIVLLAFLNMAFLTFLHITQSNL